MTLNEGWIGWKDLHSYRS